MSIERDLLKDMKILLECTSMGGLQRNADVLIGRAIELLAQPEQSNEPVAWMNDSGGCFLSDGNKYSENWTALYTSPPTREPLSEVTKATYFPRQLTEKEINEFCGYKDMKVCVVTAYRWGDRERHSYVVGIFDNLELAVEAAIAEKEWRGKYECEVISMNLNASRKYNNYTVEYKIPKVVKL